MTSALYKPGIRIAVWLVAVLYAPLSPAGESLLQKAADLKAMVAEDGSFRYGVDCLQFVHAFPSDFDDLIDIYNYRYGFYKEVRRRSRPPYDEYVNSTSLTLLGPLMTLGDLHFKRFFDCKTEVPLDLFKAKCSGQVIPDTLLRVFS